MISRSWFVRPMLCAAFVGSIALATFSPTPSRAVTSSDLIATFIGTGVAGTAGDGGPAIQAQLQNDGSGSGPILGIGYYTTASGDTDVFTTSGCQVRRVDKSGIISSLLAACNDRANGIGVDPRNGNVYYSGERSCKVWLLKRNLDQTYASTPIAVAGTGTCTVVGNGVVSGIATTINLEPLYTVSVDADGNVYVPEWYGLRLRMVAPDADGVVDGTGEQMVTLAGLGPNAGYLYKPTVATAFKDPSSGSTHVYFAAAGNQIFATDTLPCGAGTTKPACTATQIAGIGSGYGGDGGPASAAQFAGGVSQLWGLSTDGSGNLYVADNGNCRLRRIVPGADNILTGASDEIITTIAGNGTCGVSGDQGLATSAQISDDSYAVAVTPDASKLYLIDSNRARIMYQNVDTDHDGYGDALEKALGKNPAVYCATMRADVDSDSNVTSADQNLVASNSGPVPPKPARYDQNNPPDNYINVIDLQIQGRQLGRNISSCP